MHAGLPPGQIIKDWVSGMSSWLRSIDGNHMITTGEEGYRTDKQSPGAKYNWCVCE